MSTDTKCEKEGTLVVPIESIIGCPIECPTCNGTGTIYPAPMVGVDVTGGFGCPKCDGSGRL